MKKGGARKNVSYATRNDNTKSKSTWYEVIFVTFSICFMQMMQFSVFFALGFKIPLTFEPRLGTFKLTAVGSSRRHDLSGKSSKLN